MTATLEKATHDVSGEPRDSRGRWTDGPDWVPGNAGRYRTRRLSDTMHLSEEKVTSHRDSSVRLDRAFVVRKPGGDSWDDKKYEWTVGGGSLQPAGGSTIYTGSEAAAEALAEELATLHATKGSKVAQATAKERRLALEAAAKARDAAFVTNPRVGDRIVIQRSGRRYTVAAFGHDGTQTYLTMTDDKGERSSWALKDWSAEARSIKNRRGHGGGQHLTEYDDQRLGAGTAQAARDEIAAKKARKAAALKGRETYRRNKTLEWVGWAEAQVGTEIGPRGARGGKQKATHTAGIERLEDYDQYGSAVRSRSFGASAPEAGFQAEIVARKAKADEPDELVPYKVAYGNGKSADWTVKDNKGTWISYVSTGQDAERIAYALAVTAKSGGQQALMRVQATVGGWSEAEIERQWRRDWETGQYEAYSGCDVCGKPTSPASFHSYSHTDTTQTVDGKTYDFGGDGLFLCPTCSGKLEKMPIPQAHAILTGAAPMPTGRARK